MTSKCWRCELVTTAMRRRPCSSCKVSTTPGSTRVCCATFRNKANLVRVSASRPVVFATHSRWQAQTRYDLFALTNRGIVPSSSECRWWPRSFECSRKKGTRYQRERHRYPTRSLPPLRNRITSHGFQSSSARCGRLSQCALQV